MIGFTNAGAGASGGSGGTGKREVYGYYVDMDDPVPETRVHYIEDNEDYIPMACESTDTGGWHMGSWSIENCFILKGNRPCMVKSDGTIDYFLNPNSYAKKSTGGSSDVSNASYDGNAMATIPLIWVKRYTLGRQQFHLFSNEKIDGTWNAYAHTRDDGSIEPYTYVSMYCGYIENEKLRSLSGKVPGTYITLSKANSSALQNGKNWGIGYWSIVQLMWELETLFTKSTNKQAVCGYGVYNSGDNVPSSGINDQKNRFYGYGSGVNIPRKFMFCEMDCGKWEWINGWVYNNGVHKIRPYGPYNDNGDGYITLNAPSIVGTSGTAVSSTSLSEYGEVPIELNGSTDRYNCCGVWYSNTKTHTNALVNGFSNAKTLGGGSVYIEYDGTNYGYAICARLHCKTPALARVEDLLEP